jgi:phage terminase large subunit-like protein
MVEATLRAIDRNVAYRAVTASSGKVARAEPVAALYEQGRVHHVGSSECPVVATDRTPGRALLLAERSCVFD